MQPSNSKPRQKRVTTPVTELNSSHPIARIGLLKVAENKWVTIGFDDRTKSVVPIPDMPTDPYQNWP